MPLRFAIPGRPLELEHVVLDVNGTLTDRGTLLEGVADRLARVAGHAGVHLLSADTFGTLEEIAASLGVEARRGRRRRGQAPLRRGARRRALRRSRERRERRAHARGGGARIAVLSPEGASALALSAADLVCRSAAEALELLLDERALVATLRS